MMRAALLFLLAGACNLPLYAQNNPSSRTDTSIHSVELDGVVVKAITSSKFSNKIHTQNVHFHFNPTTSHPSDPVDSTFFITKIPRLENVPVMLQTVGLKLHPFDTSLFGIRVIVLQIIGSDTVYKVVPVSAGEKKQVTVALRDADIKLQPTEFYMGYGFTRKNILAEFSYRLYATTKGEGAILTFSREGLIMTRALGFPYTFPFTISYRML